jgi:hypothetical protein
MVLRPATRLPADRMSIIESHQPFAVRSVQRQRVIEAVRFLRRHRYLRHDESHSMAAFWVYNKDLPIEVEKHIEGRIARLHRATMLSD